jgi:predicted dehydrogenase
VEVFIPERRVPDAFIGPMASLMCSIEDDGTPDPSAEDNLNTIRLLHAIYESAREHQVIEMATFGV